jgi:hypothetical protein
MEMVKFKDNLTVFLNCISVMTVIGLTILLPQLQELIEFLHVMVMGDSSSFVADEQFLR